MLEGNATQLLHYYISTALFRGIESSSCRTQGDFRGPRWLSESFRSFGFMLLCLTDKQYLRSPTFKPQQLIQCVDQNLFSPVDRDANRLNTGWHPPHHSLLAIIRAGTPPTTVKESTSLLTTAPAPTTAPCPMFTPGKITAFAPTHTSSSIATGAETHFC